MATTSSLLRVKMSKKLGVSFWPWRRIHPKQLLTLEKNAKMQYRQATNLQKKKKRSQFAYQLKAKQLISTLYGNLNTQYFKTLYKKCKLLKGKNTINFFSTLEKRLDCILYRACFVTSLQEAKQLISHKKICINNNIISKPGYIVEPGDIISVVSNTSKSQAQTITNFLKADSTQQAMHSISTRFTRRIPNIMDKQQNRTKKLIQNHFDIKDSSISKMATKKLFYKPLHLEINYHILHIVYLFAPQQLYFPVQLPLQNISRAFQS
jgi:ribosomal protein S4